MSLVRRIPGYVSATHNDLVFSAYRGPVLGLSSSILHLHRAFRVELLICSSWRESHCVTRAEVLVALLTAQVYRHPNDDELHLVPEEQRCPRCGTVVTVSSPRSDGVCGEGIELYSATIRTRCSSSWGHMGARSLVLAVRLARGLEVRSQPFVVQARAPDRQIAPAPSDYSGEPALALLVRKSIEQELAVGASRSPGLFAGVCVAVRVAYITLTQEEWLWFSGMKNGAITSRLGERFLFKKSCCNPGGVYIVVFGFSTREDMIEGLTIATRFIMNDIKNPLDRNLFSDGLVRPLALATNC